MTIEISPKGELYAVHVSETMSVDETILVFADSPEEANKIARDNANFDTWDFQSDGVDSYISKKNPPLDSIHVYDYIIVNGDEYTVKEFLQEFLDSEELERLRIADIERDNGQLALTL